MYTEVTMPLDPARQVLEVYGDVLRDSFRLLRKLVPKFDALELELMDDLINKADKAVDKVETIFGKTKGSHE